jgi:hypothetical protein
LLDWPGSKKLKPEGGKQRQKLKSGKLKAEMGNQGARERKMGTARNSR